ncbi:hypothetical protein GCM10008916_12430 [Clostridium nitritogenes]|uniref:Uncharacterized protein n=1 Tax=Clostridium nitritogenes TaxID=83340 RepID=A0ABN1LLU9_9CLOT
MYKNILVSLSKFRINRHKYASLYRIFEFCDKFKIELKVD